MGELYKGEKRTNKGGGRQAGHARDEWPRKCGSYLSGGTVNCDQKAGVFVTGKKQEWGRGIWKVEDDRVGTLGGEGGDIINNPR